MNLPFELHTDWSAVELGAVLIQIDSNGKEFVNFAYASQSNNRTERNYSSYYGKCLAAVWAVSYFRIYLYGRPFLLKTNHKPFQWLMTSEKLMGMHARWASILQEYDVDIQHRSGVTRPMLPMGTLMGSRGTRYPVKRIGLMPGCIMIVL
jgi:hypothetical protein